MTDPKLHDDGSVTLFLRQGWVRTRWPSPEALATLSREQRESVVRHVSPLFEAGEIVTLTVEASDEADGGGERHVEPGTVGRVEDVRRGERGWLYTVAFPNGCTVTVGPEDGDVLRDATHCEWGACKAAATENVGERSYCADCAQVARAEAANARD